MAFLRVTRDVNNIPVARYCQKLRTLYLILYIYIVNMGGTLCQIFFSGLCVFGFYSPINGVQCHICSAVSSGSYIEVGSTELFSQNSGALIYLVYFDVYRQETKTKIQNFDFWSVARQKTEKSENWLATDQKSKF